MHKNYEWETCLSNIFDTFIFTSKMEKIKAMRYEYKMLVGFLGGLNLLSKYLIIFILDLHV